MDGAVSLLWKMPSEKVSNHKSSLTDLAHGTPRTLTKFTSIMPNRLDGLEQKLSPKAQTIFWVLYLIIPIVTGLLAYNWLPNESYNSDVHQLIASHEVSDDDGRTGIVYDVWKGQEDWRIF